MREPLRYHEGRLDGWNEGVFDVGKQAEPIELHGERRVLDRRDKARVDFEIGLWALEPGFDIHNQPKLVDRDIRSFTPQDRDALDRRMPERDKKGGEDPRDLSFRAPGSGFHGYL